MQNSKRRKKKNKKTWSVVFEFDHLIHAANLSLLLSLSLFHPMAATKNKKGGKSSSRRSSFLCSFAACFGISNTDHAHRKSLSGRHPRPALPVNDQHIPALTSELHKSTKEIHLVEDEEKTTIIPSKNQFIMTNKRDDIIISEKSKNGEESISVPIPIIKKQNSNVNETWTNRRKLSHSVSLPAAPHQKREKAAAERGKEEVGGEFDSTVGAVIVSVTLVVMIIWGKVCAVVCTAAWFYFVPRFRAKTEKSMELRNGESLSGVDLDSWEYKNKVVLQGLLHRNHNL